MKRLADRRTLLLAAATAALAAGAGAGTARPAHVEVTVNFEGGQPIPKGRLVVHLDSPAGGHPMAAQASADSGGGSGRMTLSLPLPAEMDRSSPHQIVAWLQRADGWLLARGSAPFQGRSPVVITLYTAMH